MEIIEIQNFIRESTKGTIDWGELSTQLRMWLLPYELRVFMIGALIALIVVLNLYWVKKRSGSSDRSKEEKTFDLKPLNKKLKLSGFDHPLIQHSHKIINISIILVLFVLIGASVMMKPYVIISDPQPKTYMESGGEVIEMVFDVPFDEENIKFNISPEVKGSWVTEPVSESFPLKRIAKFIPEQSILPGNEVVIYVVGIRPWFGLGKLHEQAIEFRSPRVPEVVESSVDDGAEKVHTDEEIILNYDAPVGDFVKLDLQFDPEVQFDLVKIDNSKQKVVFKEELQQDTEYSYELYRTPRSFSPKTGEDIELGETKLMQKVAFKTVTTPFVESYEPNGGAAKVDSEIKIIFDQPMDQQSVQENFMISPDTEGEFIWDEQRTLRFIPDKPLAKETDYEISFGVGIASSESGVIDKEISMKFSTIGKVKILSTSPVNGTTGHNPSSTNIVIEFDQEVDKQSAQSKFLITPSVIGTFSWDGNKMIYKTAGSLNYSTQYSYSVRAGVKSINGLDSVKDHNFSFSTKANIYSLDMPLYLQQEGFTCNIAASRMVLAYRGVYVNESTVKNGVGIGTNPNSDWVPGYGVHVGPVASYIGQYRKVAIKTGWNTAELAKEVEKGNPVIVWWYNRYSPKELYTLSSGVTAYRGMHSEVVRGFIGDSSNPTSLLTNDPWRGRLTYSRALFDSTWSYLGYTALVIY